MTSSCKLGCSSRASVTCMCGFGSICCLAMSPFHHTTCHRRFACMFMHVRAQACCRSTTAGSFASRSGSHRRRDRISIGEPWRFRWNLLRLRRGSLICSCIHVCPIHAHVAHFNMECHMLELHDIAHGRNIMCSLFNCYTHVCCSHVRAAADVAEQEEAATPAKARLHA